MAFPVEWNRKCPLVIQASQIDSDLTNFPVLLTQANFPTEMLDADGSYPAQNGGGDIRFSSDSAGASQLACEVVSFVTNNNPASATAQVYVKVSSISSSIDTTIYVWYNVTSVQSQPARNASYGMEEVWNNGYVGVYHLEQNPGTTADGWIDSTSSLAHGTGAGGTGSPGTTTGQIGAAASFVATSTQYVQIKSALLINRDNYCIECWKYEPTSVGTRILIWEGKATENGWGNGSETHLAQNNLAGESDFARCSTTDVNTNIQTYLSANTWQYRAFRVVDANTSSPDGKSWVNTSTATSTGTTNVDYSGFDTNMRFGRPGTAQRFWNGYLDEIRISSSVRADGWISASYNNQSAPSTFVVEGTPQSTRTRFFVMWVPGL